MPSTTAQRKAVSRASTDDVSATPTIVTVSQGYPSEMYVAEKTFVHALMREFSALGVEPTVIAPEPLYPVTRHPALWGRFRRLPPKHESYDGIEVLRPRYMSLPTKRLPVLGSTDRLTVWNFTRATARVGESVPARPLACYGHHIYPAGGAALSMARQLGVPAIVGLGGVFASYEAQMGYGRLRRDLNSFAGIIAGTLETKDACVERYGVPGDRIVVLPNGVDQTAFQPQDKTGARRRLGLPMDRPIIAFVGRLVDGKGPRQLLDAVRPRPDIGVVFIGEGPIKLEGPQVLFSGAVPHGDVPTWLNAADIFALPTRSEGSCNAVLEAMACGLPIVTSDIPAMHEVLDAESAIMVDPRDVDEIRAALFALVDDSDRRERMAAAALSRVGSLSVRDRARRIIEWLGELQPA